MRETLKYSFILGLICFLSSGILAVVNGLTEEKILLEKEHTLNEALKEIMPQANAFKPRIEKEKIIYYSVYDKANKLSGFIFKAEGTGYASSIEALAGLNLNLEISAVKILSHNETPGMGSRITEPQFLGQFSGKNLEAFSRVEAITGATISSSAVIRAIKDKISELKGKFIQEIYHGR